MPDAQHPPFDTFVATVAKLRSPDGGCPWNCAQTHESLGEYLIEEAYETLDAIESRDATHLKEELGDVLLQVVLQSQVAADADEFTIDDVCECINDKMVRRHPHVFGDLDASNANEVADLWEQVKLAEKQAAGQGRPDKREGLLDAVPSHFPALLQAEKISRKAVAVGFEWESLEDVWDKVREEQAELDEAYAAAPKDDDGRVLASKSGDDALVHAVELEFGDLLFALVNVGRKMGISAENALRASNAKFRRRFSEVEKTAWTEGREIEDLTLDEMESRWQRAKEDE